MGGVVDDNGDASRTAQASEDYLLRLAIAVNRRVNACGLFLRMVCLVALAGSAVGSGGVAGLRALTLVPGILGLVLARLELEAKPLDTWKERDGGFGRLAAHLVACREKAAVSLSGTLEGLGVLAAVFFVGGPSPLPLPEVLHAVALAAFTLYVFDVALQIALDAGYYNELQPPVAWMRTVRAALPPILAVSAAALLRWSPATPTAAAVLLGATMLLLWPLLAILGTVYDCGRKAASDWVLREQSSARDARAEALHHVKGRIFGQLLDEAAAAPDGCSPNELVYQRLRAAVETERRLTLDGKERSSVAEVWKDAYITMEQLKAAQAQGRLILHDETGKASLDEEDATLLRSLLLDLADNATRHGGPQVRARVWLEPLSRAGRFSLRLTVHDNGAGYQPPDPLPPGSSLACLERLVRVRRGTWKLGPAEDGGTVADVSFPATIVGGPPAIATEHPMETAQRSLAGAPA